MKKIKNILIIGLGSIGTRHFKTIKKLRPNIKINLLRRKESNANSLEKEANKIFYDIDDALKEDLDGVIIASPSPMHINQAMKFLNLNIPLFIEKPISNNLDDCWEFKKLVKSKNSIILVGYVLRHSQILNKFKKIIQNNLIGNHLYVEIKYSSYLPEWRKNSNYKNNVSSNYSLGGGALLELSHEIDYANWLFGPFINFHSLNTNSKELEINVEDMVKIIAINSKDCLIDIHLDFCYKGLERYCNIYGSNGLIRLDFLKGEIITKLHSEKTTKKLKISEKYDEMYINQMQHFFKCIESDIKPMVNVEEAIEILKIIEKCKDPSYNLS